MKRVSRFLIAILLALALGACALLGDPIAEQVAGVIDDYCTEPFQARQLYRDTVNEKLAAEGHSITVTCFGDPEDVTAIGGAVSDDIAAAVDAYCVAPGAAFASTRHRVDVQCRGAPEEGGQWTT